MKAKMTPLQVIEHAKGMSRIIINTFNTSQEDYRKGVVHGAKMMLTVLERYDPATTEYVFFKEEGDDE